MTNGEYSALRYIFVSAYFLVLLTIFLINFLAVKEENKVKWATFSLKLGISISYIFVVILKVIGYSSGLFKQYYVNSISPISNFSPLTFTLIFVSLFLFKWKKFISFLDNWICYIWLGMAIAAIVSPLGSVSSALSNRTMSFEPIYFIDCSGHVLTAILGLYLVKTKQTTPSWKNYGVACVFAGSVVTTILIINAIFKTGFFGLTFYGKPDIYNVKFTTNPFLNIFVYVIGLGGLLIITQLIYRAYFAKKAKKAILAK